MQEAVLIELISSIFSLIGIFVSTFGAMVLARKKISKKNTDIALKNHHIFSKIEFNKNIINTRFTLENKGKEIVFKSILIAHMDIFKNKIDIFINDINKAEISEYYILSLDCLNEIIFEINNFYKSSYDFTDEEKKVLEIVMSKYSFWNKSRDEDFLERVQEICASNVYQDKNVKSFLILDTFMFLINDIVEDCNKTLKLINGDLKGLKFKGVII